MNPKQWKMIGAGAALFIGVVMVVVSETPWYVAAYCVLLGAAILAAVVRNNPDLTDKYGRKA
jgi:peptidoglycan/LPS O-acetylase OafA/YrhL